MDYNQRQPTNQSINPRHRQQIINKRLHPSTMDLKYPEIPIFISSTDLSVESQHIRHRRTQMK